MINGRINNASDELDALLTRHPMLEPTVFAVLAELERATVLNGPMTSLHEAHSVIEEEFDEFWDEVKKNPRKHPERKDLAHKELIQLAAMSLRAIIDVCVK